MEKLSLDLPAMYGDHHVTEVRRILTEIPGVEDVYASSSFRMVEITYDPAKVKDKDLRAKLDEAGYLGDLQVPTEPGAPAVGQNGQEYFRHTVAYETVGGVVSFGQAVSYSGRPLWPCPGMGPISTMDEGK